MVHTAKPVLRIWRMAVEVSSVIQYILSFIKLRSYFKLVLKKKTRVYTNQMEAFRQNYPYAVMIKNQIEKRFHKMVSCKQASAYVIWCIMIILFLFTVAKCFSDTKLWLNWYFLTARYCLQSKITFNRCDKHVLYLVLINISLREALLNKEFYFLGLCCPWHYP